jgi:hypothetical protein
MADSEISNELKNFIRVRIESVAQIEALLLIGRSDVREIWTVHEVARNLYIAEKEAAKALLKLCGADLLVQAGKGFTLEGVSLQSRLRIDQLLEAYTNHLIPVTNLIHEKLDLPAEADRDK